MTSSHESEKALLESLSAMFDDEASEQDLDTLLQQDITELNRKMTPYHLAQQSLRKDSDSEVAIDGSLNLATLVSRQIAAEDDAPESNKVVAFTPKAAYKATAKGRPLWAGFAVAASVAFVVVLGGDKILNLDSASAPTLASTQTVETSDVPVLLSDLKKQPMDTDSLRLQNYLRQHAEQATMTVGQGMIPMARIASYPTKE